MYYAPKSKPGSLPGTAAAGPAHRASPGAPILLRERRLICRNQVFSVYLDHIEERDGRQVRDYLSIVPRSAAPDCVSGVAVLPEADGKLGLVRVYRHPLGATAWEVPRGFIDPSESPKDAALRELREEIGIEARAEKLVTLGLMAPEPGVIEARIQLFAARECTLIETHRPSEFGHAERRLFSSKQVEEMIHAGEIQDPSTLVSYYRYMQIPDRDFARPTTS